MAFLKNKVTTITKIGFCKNRSQLKRMKWSRPLIKSNRRSRLGTVTRMINRRSPRVRRSSHRRDQRLPLIIIRIGNSFKITTRGRNWPNNSIAHRREHQRLGLISMLRRFQTLEVERNRDHQIRWEIITVSTLKLHHLWLLKEHKIRPLHEVETLRPLPRAIQANKKSWLLVMTFLSNMLLD